MNYQQGFLKIPRRLFQDPVFKDRKNLFIFLEIIQRCNYREVPFFSHGRKVMLSPGHAYLGLDELAKVTGYTRMQVRVTMKQLAHNHYITSSQHPRGTLVKVLNFLDYQGDARIEESANLESNNHQITSSQPAHNHQVAPKEELRIRNKKEETITKPPASVNRLPAAKPPEFDFERVYRIYPRKKGKAPGLAACKRMIKTEADYADLLKAVENFRKDRETKDNGPENQFIPYFSSWINQYWADWINPEPEELLGKKPNDGIVSDGSWVKSYAPKVVELAVPIPAPEPIPEKATEEEIQERKKALREFLKQTALSAEMAAIKSTERRYISPERKLEQLKKQLEVVGDPRPISTAN